MWVGFTGVGVELERGEAHLGGALEAAEEELELPRRGHLGRQEDATGGGGGGGGGPGRLILRGCGGGGGLVRLGGRRLLLLELLLLLLRRRGDGIGGVLGEGFGGFVRVLPLAGGGGGRPGLRRRHSGVGGFRGGGGLLLGF